MTWTVNSTKTQWLSTFLAVTIFLPREDTRSKDQQRQQTDNVWDPFTTWALSRSILCSRTRILTAGAAAAGVTFAGALMAGGCLLTGCCGSPMLAVYLCLFAVTASVVGKPLIALVTIFSVSRGYW